MAKPSSHIEPLPVGLGPWTSSTDLICEHIERLRASGVPQKVVALSLGFGSNYISMLKSRKDELPLPRIIAFAHVLGLTEAQREELLHTRLLELHGQKGEICVETLAQWAKDLCALVGDEALLLQAWQEATAPAPQLLWGVLDNPKAYQRIRDAMVEVAQAELQKMAAEANQP